MRNFPYKDCRVSELVTIIMLPTQPPEHTQQTRLKMSHLAPEDTLTTTEGDIIDTRCISKNSEEFIQQCL